LSHRRSFSWDLVNEIYPISSAVFLPVIDGQSVCSPGVLCLDPVLPHSLSQEMSFKLVPKQRLANAYSQSSALPCRSAIVPTRTAVGVVTEEFLCVATCRSIIDQLNQSARIDLQGRSLHRSSCLENTPAEQGPSIEFRASSENAQSALANIHQPGTSRWQRFCRGVSSQFAKWSLPLANRHRNLSLRALCLRAS